MTTQVPRNQTTSGAAGHDRRERSQTLHDLRQRVEYVLLRALAATARCLPLVLAYWLLEILLLAAMRFGPLRRRMQDTREQIEIAYDDGQDAVWKERLARESVRYFAWYVVDILLGPSRVRDAAWWGCVDVASVDAVLRRDSIGEQTGALLVGAHHGAPDVGSLALALAGHPHTTIVNRIANPRILSYVEHQRRDVPREDIVQEGALRACRRVLKGKGIVVLQIDTDAGRGGVFVPYFGRRASTSGGAATLVLIADSPVYMVSCVRTRRRRAEYRVTIEGPLEFERTGTHATDVRTLAAVATRAIEDIVRAHPEQMTWTHRRWKTRPFQSRRRKRIRARAAHQAREKEREKEREAEADLD